MRVLYALGNYPKLSESYVAAEIRYVQTQGVDVRVWSPRYGTDGAPELVPVYRGTLEEALSGFNPDLIHAHYVQEGWIYVLKPAVAAGIPITARGHSYEFDIARVHAFCGQPGIKRIWLFPHFARYFTHEKVRPLPVAFDSTRYNPLELGQNKHRKMVIRTAAGKMDKGLQDFIEIARMCPEFSFRMVVDPVKESGRYIDDLKAMASGSQVQIFSGIPDWAVTEMVKQSGIYLETSDPAGHPFGMPISIAESMATGSYVLAREAPFIDTYLSGAGHTYRTTSLAAVMINSTRAWGDAEWSGVSARAVASSKKYEDVHVLPAIVDGWREISGKK